MSLSQAIYFTLQAEKGYSRDDGGTMYGVTQAVYDTYRESVGLPYQDVAAIRMSEVQAIMLHTYWLPGGCDKMPARLGIAHFDTAYNEGVEEAIKILQHALGITADGIFGPETMHGVAAAEQINLLASYLNARRNSYHEIVAANPSKEKFLQGWLNRVYALEKYLRSIA